MLRVPKLSWITSLIITNNTTTRETNRYLLLMNRAICTTVSVHQRIACASPPLLVFNKKVRSKVLFQKSAALSTSSQNPASTLKRTALYDFHLAHQAKMVPFAGYEMPVVYGDQTIRDSHLHTRTDASLFDVSHMLQLRITGDDAEKFFSTLVVADLHQLPPNGATLTLYTTPQGGIIDDLIVTKKKKRDGSLYVVSNAARATEDLRHLYANKEKYLQQNPQAKLSIEVMTDHSLLALQGPQAAQVLQSNVSEDLTQLKFMNSLDTSINIGENDSIPIGITRCGYTGEDGFELCIVNKYATALANQLLSNKIVKLAGLGARDTLRLEAGLCLYGNDIDEHTTPIEAGLSWTIGKQRRKVESANFPGADVILKQLKEKNTVGKRRVGLIATTTSGPPVRAHAKVYRNDPKFASIPIGEVTSGCPAPSLGQNIAMAYINTVASDVGGQVSTKVGTKVLCEIRGKLYEYQICKMPFVPTRYYV